MLSSVTYSRSPGPDSLAPFRAEGGCVASGARSIPRLPQLRPEGRVAPGEVPEPLPQTVQGDAVPHPPDDGSLTPL